MHISATPTVTIQPRQLWNLPTPDTASQPCPTITLVSGGALTLGPSLISTLTSDILYQPLCTANADLDIIADNGRGPFYSSTTPLIYVVAATTVMAWALIIMVLLTSESKFSSVSSGSLNLLPGRGVLGAVIGRGSIFGSGSRPWLQKVAGILVAISLTIATADTFKVAQQQYENGWMSGENMRDDVAGSLEIRVTRVVSDAFLWLAQVQTLIRLFPRHKEKLIIKWIGFLLIILDIVFSAINSFLVDTQRRPRSYQDAIPALSYTFQLSLSLLYAAWVFYYVVTKRRYAFYHYMMPNISIVAFLSIISILIPVVFFVVDIIKPEVGGWGDYFRWVGSAASSIVVWEWVDRIEALEREEKKDGILGREIFDEDDMIDARSTQHSERTSDGDPSGSTLYSRKNGGLLENRFLKPLVGAFGIHKGTRSSSTSIVEQEKPDVSGRSAQPQKPSKTGEKPSVEDTGNQTLGHKDPPVDRRQTESANSTIYAVHYHPVVYTPPTVLAAAQNDVAEREPASNPKETTTAELAKSVDRETNSHQNSQKPTSRALPASNPVWNLAVNAFKKRKKSPPIEVKNALSVDEVARGRGGQSSQTRWWQVSRLGQIASESEDRQSGASKRRQSLMPVQPTIIPAPPRGHTWSPELHRHSATTPLNSTTPNERETPAKRTSSGSPRLPGSGHPDNENDPSSGESTAVPSSKDKNVRSSTISPQNAQELPRKEGGPSSTGDEDDRGQGV